MDLWGNKEKDSPIEVNIFADEIFAKKCKHSGHSWHYIGIIVENINKPLLSKILEERFPNNCDTTDKHYEKNNKIVHWSELRTADTKNICKRWFEFIVNTSKSFDCFYSSILGINNSYLNIKEFDSDNDFNSKYNRFFRTSIKYALKCFFGNKKIIIKNIYHEQGQQKDSDIFSWHSIHKLEQETNFIFENREIKFLQKNHRIDKKSNMIQLCDSFMGAVTTIIHGFDESKNAKYRKELLDILYPLVHRMINKHRNPNSPYAHKNRIIIRFFPKEKTELGDFERNLNQFYTKRKLNYNIDSSKQLNFF